MFFQRMLFRLIVNILYLFAVDSALVMEELKSLNYEVDISVTPIEKDNSDSVVHITSQSGQKFQCALPQLNEDEISEKEVINEKDNDVMQLLKPMKDSPCLTKGKDWWTYEFCFGHYIKQYHVEDGHITGQVITLGLYESDFDWNNKTSQEKFKHTKQKYHSQYYTNGTKCDLTGQPRNAEVRIYCEEDAGDYIFRVDEPGTCSYIITIHTSRLCSHSQLKPLPTKKAHVISCQPLLNDIQYSIYLQKLNEEKAAAEAKRNQWLNNQQERLQVLKNENELVEEENKHAKSKTEEHQSVDQEIFYQFILETLEKELEEMKKKLAPEKFTAIKKELDKIIDTVLQQEGKDFSSESSKDAYFSSELLKAIDKFFAMILGSEEEESEEENGQSDESHKEKSINKDSDIKDQEHNLEKKKDSKNDDMVEGSDSYKLKNSVKTKKESFSDIVEDIVNKINGIQPIQDHSDDDTVQVQIRRIARRFPSDSSAKQREMDFEQRKKLERAVKEKLEMAGLDTGGRKIEVKIITAGHYDNEDGMDFPSLTDEETDQFQNMIVALLTGEQEAVEEMKRHQKLEESYKFTWNDDDEDDDEGT